uniref:Uncharacterized protein n=1 Tax=Myoviridae sp. ct1ba2 TaxID=2827654 RepID=A0A8S5S691_9CAUD|nr:MAG TPA: hypothetical protein [Myoviridae sp. ct1ba2]
MSFRTCFSPFSDSYFIFLTSFTLQLYYTLV